MPHDGLGHPGKERFLRILANSKASSKVMEIAKSLKCSVCEKFRLPRPSRVAAPPKEIGLNEIVGIDTNPIESSLLKQDQVLHQHCGLQQSFPAGGPIDGTHCRKLHELDIDCG